MPVFAVTTAKGPHWDEARPLREQPHWDEHAAFADALVRRGVIILGGPVASDDPGDIALLAVEAADEQAVTAAFGSGQGDQQVLAPGARLAGGAGLGWQT